MEEEITIEEKEKQIIKNIFKKKTIFVILALVLLLGLAWYTRTINVPILKDVTTGDYTLGPDLDPWLFTRYAKTIIENGSLPEIDSMRYAPLGYPSSKETQLLPYMIVYFHKFLLLFSNVTINYSAVMFPAFMFILTAFAFFLFVNKLFEGKKFGSIIALIALALFIVSPSILPRTIAGIPEKESVAFLFMFLTFYFFLSSWKSTKLRNSLIFASLAGISTGVMGLIWGGWVYIFTTISAFSLIAFIFGKNNKQAFFSYTIWLALSYIIPLIFSGRVKISLLLTSTATAISNIIFLLLLVDFLIFNTKLKEIKFIQKFPRPIVSIAFALIPIIILSISLGASFLPHLFQDLIIKLTNPYVDRLSLTVAENRQPYYLEWKGNFFPIVKDFSIFFWMFFIGSIILFYEIVKKLNLKENIILVSSYTLFLFAFIFTRYSQGSTFNGVNMISKVVYFGGFILLMGSFGYVLYHLKKEGRLGILGEIDYNYLFLITFFIVCIIGARSAIRLIMVLSIPAGIIVAYSLIFIIEASRKYKQIFFVSIGIACLLGAFIFYSNYQITIGTAKNFGPNVYNQQWQKAMFWVRGNTAGDAIFSSWWDYGYWIQSIGERPTVLDGGNSISYWDHLIGRHVLTGTNETDALEFLYTHNVSYLLIDSTDVGKYTAYSNIGSDESYDRYSWIGTFTLNEKNTQETKYEIRQFYTGGTALDEDYVYMDNSTGKQTLFPAGWAGVGAMVFVTDAHNNTLKQPYMIFVYENQQISLPLRYLYFQDKMYDFERGYGGCLYILPTFSGSSLNQMGGALFLSERNMRALWVRLYLLGEGENFRLAYSEPDFLVNELKKQNISVGDFVLYGGFRGPIKIWKVNYPKNIEFKEEYLSKEYPASLKYV